MNSNHIWYCVVCWFVVLKQKLDSFFSFWFVMASIVIVYYIAVKRCSERQRKHLEISKKILDSENKLFRQILETDRVHLIDSCRRALWTHENHESSRIDFNWITYSLEWLVCYWTGSAGTGTVMVSANDDLNLSRSRTK